MAGIVGTVVGAVVGTVVGAVVGAVVSSLLFIRHAARDKHSNSAKTIIADFFISIPPDFLFRIYYPTIKTIYPGKNRQIYVKILKKLFFAIAIYKILLYNTLVKICGREAASYEETCC
jgi:hypothetical protein